MPWEHVFRDLQAIMLRADVHYSQVAVACSISPATARAVVMSGAPPSRSHSRRALEQFVAKNRDAAARGDLRFV